MQIHSFQFVHLFPHNPLSVYKPHSITRYKVISKLLSSLRMEPSKMLPKCQVFRNYPKFKQNFLIIFQHSMILMILLVQVGRLAAANSMGKDTVSRFPGVSEELSSFCTGMPSLPIEVASMIVHVKKNASFNYKLYLFSGEHVFQTGQVIPRDDFRIHSFPVRLKKLDQFWSAQVATLTYLNATPDSLSMIEPSRFRLHDFLASVSLVGSDIFIPERPTLDEHPAEAFRLPGEEQLGSSEIDEVNSGIEFDRDDQISVARLPSSYMQENVQESNRFTETVKQKQHTILPVGSFSSFHVNLTYLVRKDFGQVEPELIRIQVDAAEFSVSELVLISDGKQPVGSYPRHPDYDFLYHNLLRDPNTRITSINQIYEDWITRNLYTIVYIQRRLSPSGEDSASTASKGNRQSIVSDRLIFRGSSRALLSADQLDYHVTAAAFITEKNGLHYYLEFLTSGKFYLCAIDWTKRPFKIIDSRRLPMKATRTQLDTEELLLCPPAPCHSSQPLDEIVTYGRLFKDKSGFSGTNTKLHLRDWNWPLQRLAASKSRLFESQSFLNYPNTDRSERNEAPYSWRYELARRNDIKVKPDTYGYALTGHEIDASYRVHNELYLVSANHLITINYTLENETVTSTHQIGLEFPGLSSTLLDPITGALYDQSSDQIYFFKGDRYLGFHYSTRKPLEEFQLPAQGISSSGFLFEHPPDQQQPLISSLPVVEILGRQHEVDGVFHDLESDLIYIFTGMKFYIFRTSEFKNGSFKPEAQSLPQMLCINEFFLKGCTFDKVHENPCKTERLSSPVATIAPPTTSRMDQNRGHQSFNGGSDRLVETQTVEGNLPSSDMEKFKEEQQRRLRSIASRPRSLLGFSLLGGSSADSARAAFVQPLLDATTEQVYEASLVADHQQIVVYLLMALVSIATLVSVVLLVLLITCAAQQRRRTPVIPQLARKYKPKQAQPTSYWTRRLDSARQTDYQAGNLQLYIPQQSTPETQETRLNTLTCSQIIGPTIEELHVRKCHVNNCLVNKTSQKKLDSTDSSVL